MQLPKNGVAKGKSLRRRGRLSPVKFNILHAPRRRPNQCLSFIRRPKKGRAPLARGFGGWAGNPSCPVAMDANSSGETAQTLSSADSSLGAHHHFVMTNY
jgi:hypothetical protein